MILCTYKNVLNQEMKRNDLATAQDPPPQKNEIQASEDRDPSGRQDLKSSDSGHIPHTAQWGLVNRGLYYCFCFMNHKMILKT